MSGKHWSKAASDKAVELLHNQQKRHVKRINYKLIASQLEEEEKSWAFTNQQVRDHIKNLDPAVIKLTKSKKDKKKKRKRESSSSESDSDFKETKGKSEEDSSSDESSSSESHYQAFEHRQFDLKLSKPLMVIPPVDVETDLCAGQLFYRVPRTTTTWDIEIDSETNKPSLACNIEQIVARKEEIEAIVTESSAGMIPEKVNEQATLEQPAPLPREGDPRWNQALEEDRPERVLGTLIQRPVQVKDIHQTSKIKIGMPLPDKADPYGTWWVLTPTDHHNPFHGVMFMKKLEGELAQKHKTSSMAEEQVIAEALKCQAIMRLGQAFTAKNRSKKMRLDFVDPSLQSHLQPHPLMSNQLQQSLSSSSTTVNTEKNVDPLLPNVQEQAHGGLL